ncbi:hypothetical protein RND81_13G172000 [Saponaria officinalis]|uniref:HAT C-terminal dimerisation domain-containing protein n=1 Tax=Saponaria officinalis TaxID=3572 RepID=A0AAW1GZ40_SAPOF
MRDLLVEKGPIRETNLKYPKDDKNRGFSSFYYERKLRNNEIIDRNWLVYSKELNKVFCFCCKVVKEIRSTSFLASVGVNDWIHLSEKLKSHEECREHVLNLKAWAELRVRLRSNQTIDKEIQEQIKKDTEHWRQVMIRIISVIKRLAMNNLAFRGSNAKVYDDSNGNFLGFLETIAEFDQTLQHHFRLIQDKEIHYHYLSNKIQNELILMLASNAKYFSVILDCTPDASHIEQMTLIIRCVNVASLPIKVEEYFLEFLNDALISLDLNINDVRGQGYDNGSNMKGKHQGVQKRLLDINPRAFYMPCGCHSLNLVLSDMANSCARAKSFFGSCQALYNDRIESVKAIKIQAPKIQEALIKLIDVSDDPQISWNAEKLASGEFKSFEFILSLVIWYEILNMRLDVALQSLKGLILFFEKYREMGFISAMTEAKEIANKMDIDPVFQEKRKVTKNRKYDENPNTEREQQSAEEKFRIDYFLILVDMAISQIKIRFEQTELFESIFDDEDMKFFSIKLEDALTFGAECDINLACFCTELQILHVILPSEAYDGEVPWNAIKIAEFVKEMKMFPNILIAYRILLTIPITVASAERSFSKLKLIKLNELAILSIEKNMLKNLNVEDIIDDFASKNARRVHFR